MVEAIEEVTDGLRGLTQRVRDLESTVLDSREGGVESAGQLAEGVEDRVAARLEDAMLALREEMRALAEETPTGSRTAIQRDI
jgi:hypothetical protein